MSVQRRYPYTMPRSFASRRRWLSALLATVLGACDSPHDELSRHDTEQRLVGTWLREYTEDGVNVRRVLVLEPGGRFREMARAGGAGVPLAEHSHAGEWLFDGTNLKRRYTSMDGEQPSAPTVPFATFEIRFPSRNEFIGIDRVHRREVAYRRVPEGTQP
jgi:hypothetical protein